MALSPGTALGSYEVVSALGAGGMGEVYRARDMKLGRSVAIKVLPEALAADADRITRFEREAQALAALNHPHIAILHGMEQAGGRHFLVMELVEGETLAERILRGALPLDAALRIAGQIAEALEAAHEKGIVHRDLKPANVKITPDEKAKVLDFGLAKAIEKEPAAAASGAHSPTLSVMATQAGIILGTASYMSPEQAKGLAADHRSDVFSFGVVLYEMLTGRQPFSGDTVPDIMASVLVREPELLALPPNLNPRLYELVKRCLEKSPKRRWQAMGDVRAEIETIAASPIAAPAADLVGALPPRPLWQRAIPIALTAIAASALTAAVLWYFRPVSLPMVTRFPILMGEGQELPRSTRRVIAISPDGASIAYVLAGRLIYLRTISDLEARPIAGTEALTASDLAFSPDGRSIAFLDVASQSLKRIATSGGAAVTICPATEGMYGITWDGESILFGQGSGIYRVPATGGKPEVLVRTQADEQVYGPQMLPDGETLLFTLATTGADRWNQARVVAQSLKSGTRKTLVEGGAAARYVSTGHLVYALGGVLLAVPFDVKRLASTGGAVPVIEGVRRGTSDAGFSATANFGVSATGTLVYIPGPVSLSSSQLQLALIDRKGRVEPLKIAPGSYQHPRVSPDGSRIVVGSDDGKDSSLWVYDLGAAASLRRLTFGGRNSSPVWSADSQRVAFQSDREGDLGIFWQRADGSGTAERLSRPEPGTAHVPTSWCSDRERFLYDATKDGRTSLWTYSLRDRKATPFDAVESTTPTGAQFSPDGRWVAYSIREKGTRNIVFLQPFPPTGAKYQISKSSEDGHHPLWSPDGTEIVYTPGGGSRLVAVPIATKPTVTFGDPVPVPRPFQNASPAYASPYDMGRDGRQFLGLVHPQQAQTGAPAAPRIQVVLNWFEELKQRVPVP